MNISVATLLAVDLSSLLTSRTRRLCLEITEHEMVGDYPAVRAAVEQLHGVDLAVDDAGAGYASLRHVYELRPQVVKLDRAWISGIDGDPLRRALVRAVSDFAREFGATLVCEGVERREEAAALEALGIPRAQGFWFGQPAPASDWA